jgi:hypothetical protein
MILELADVQFLRVEAEEKANISIEFQVAAVPTVLFFRGGKILQYVSCKDSIKDSSSSFRAAIGPC